MIARSTSRSAQASESASEITVSEVSMPEVSTSVERRERRGGGQFLRRLERLGAWLAEHDRSDDATEKPAEVVLPGDMRVTGYDSGQYDAVEKTDQRGDRDRPPRALDHTAHQQEAEVPEDHPARADRDAVAWPEEPDTEAAGHHDERRYLEEPASPGREHEGAGQQQRDTVAVQVGPARMQERREEDPIEARGVPDGDAGPGVEVMAGALVDQLDEEQQRN